MIQFVEGTSSKVRANKTITLPPNSETIVKTKITTKIPAGVTGICTPVTPIMSGDFCIEKCIVKVDFDGMILLKYNGSVVVYKHTLLAQFMVLDESFDLVSMSTRSNGVNSGYGSKLQANFVSDESKENFGKQHICKIVGRTNFSLILMYLHLC